MLVFQTKGCCTIIKAPSPPVNWSFLGHSSSNIQKRTEIVCFFWGLHVLLFCLLDCFWTVLIVSLINHKKNSTMKTAYSWNIKYYTCSKNVQKHSLVEINNRRLPAARRSISWGWRRGRPFGCRCSHGNNHSAAGSARHHTWAVPPPHLPHPQSETRTAMPPSASHSGHGRSIYVPGCKPWAKHWSVTSLA